MPRLAQHIQAVGHRLPAEGPWADQIPEQNVLYRKTFSNDADAHAESLAKWDQSYDQLSAGRFHGVLREIWLGDMQLFRETTNQSVLQRGRAWSGGGTFGVPLEMSHAGFFYDQALSNSGILSFGPESIFELRTPRAFDIAGITVNAECFNSILESTLGSLSQNEKVKPRVLPCNQHLQQLKMFLIDIFEALDADPHRLDGPQIQKILRATIIDHLQAALEAGTSGAKSASSYMARKNIVEQAREHVLTNLHDPVSIGELCARIGVSRRTLQYCFQDIIGANPVSFLRAIRLNKVRRELRAANFGTVQIADIATRWGFWHLSHFSNYYRALFGELPSETLRGSR